MAEKNEERRFDQAEEKNLNRLAGEKQSGYCPYTPDRNCKTAKGGWSDSEECRECGWRAW